VPRGGPAGEPRCPGVDLGGVGGDDDLVDVLGGEAGVGDRLIGRRGRQINGRFIIGGETPLPDAGALEDPLVVGVDEFRPVLVGHHA
jgi:hypothetical protein